MNIAATGTVAVPVQRRVATTHGRGYYWEATGEKRDYRVTVYVDGQQIIRQLGMRAALNRSGKARYMKGAIIVEAKP